MCSNFQPIRIEHSESVIDNFKCELPREPCREEAYPTYEAPFIYLDGCKPRCELARFGLVPYWAKDKAKFGLKTYNARTETVHEKPSYRNAWKERRFGLILMESFYEPNWETGKAIRWRIDRTDKEPLVAASIWERFTDRETGEIIMSFSMLTVNADGHQVMKHFHKPQVEKRSIVILSNNEYLPWLAATHDEARKLLIVSSGGFLTGKASPK